MLFRFAVWTSLAACYSAQAATLPELDAVRMGYETRMTSFSERMGKMREQVRQRYAIDLATSEKEQKSSGDLNAILALRSEMVRFSTDRTVPEKTDGFPPALTQIVRKAQQANQKAEIDFLKSQLGLTEQYLSRLKTLQRKLVSGDKIRAAVEVRAEQEKRQKELAKIREKINVVTKAANPAGGADRSDAIRYAYLHTKDWEVLMYHLGEKPRAWTLQAKGRQFFMQSGIRRFFVLTRKLDKPRKNGIIRAKLIPMESYPGGGSLRLEFLSNQRGEVLAAPFPSEAGSKKSITYFQRKSGESDNLGDYVTVVLRPKSRAILDFRLIDDSVEVYQGSELIQKERRPRMKDFDAIRLTFFQLSAEIFSIELL